MSAANDPWAVVSSEPLAAAKPAKTSKASEWDVVKSEPIESRPAVQRESAPSRGVGTRIKDALVGANTVAGNMTEPRRPDTGPWYKSVLPRVGLDLIIPGLGSAAPEAAITKPIVDVSAIGAEDLVPGTGKVSQAARGTVKGIESFATSQSTPETVAIIAGTGGLGAAGAGAGAAAKVAHGLSRLVSAGFGADMLKGAVEKFPDLRKQIEDGDLEAAAETAVNMGLTTFLGLGAAKHALKSGPKVPNVKQSEQTPPGNPPGSPPPPPGNPPSTPPATVEAKPAEPTPGTGEEPPAPPAVKAKTPAEEQAEKESKKIRRGEKYSEWRARVSGKPLPVEAPKAEAEKPKKETKPLPPAKPGITIKTFKEEIKPENETPEQELARMRALNDKLRLFSNDPAPPAKPAIEKPKGPVKATEPVVGKVLPKVKTQVELKKEREAKAAAEVKTAVGGAAKGIVDAMHDNLWAKVQAGDTKEAGGESAVLQVAKKAREAGGLKTPEEFRSLAKEYGDIKTTGEERQKALGDLVKKYSAETKPAEPETKPAEPETKKPHEFSSTQVGLSPELHQDFAKATQLIPDEDLAEDGRETDPHITVKFGLHDGSPDATRKALSGEGPVKAKLGKVSVFKNDKFDVVKLDIESPDLHRLNGKISELPNTDTHPEYKPHMTLAYVKPGLGEKYEGKEIPGLTGKEIPFDKVTFSAKDRTKTDISLDSQSDTSIEQGKGVVESASPAEPKPDLNLELEKARAENARLKSEQPPADTDNATPADRDKAAARALFDGERKKEEAKKPLNLRKKLQEQTGAVATAPAKPARSAPAVDLPRPAIDRSAPALSNIGQPEVETGPAPNPSAASAMTSIFQTAQPNGYEKLILRRVDEAGKPVGDPVEMNMAGDPKAEIRKAAQAMGEHSGGVTIEPVKAQNPNGERLANNDKMTKWFRVIDDPRTAVTASEAKPGIEPAKEHAEKLEPFTDIKSSRKILGHPPGSVFAFVEEVPEGFRVMDPNGNTQVISLQDAATFSRVEESAPEVVKPAVKRKGERGSASLEFISAGMSTAFEKLREKMRRDPSEPKPNYSGLGAIRSRFVRNLGQLEKASDKAAQEAIRTAASRSQAAAIINENYPAIQQALKPIGMNIEDFNLTMIQGRLYGIRDRWLDYAQQVDKISDEDLPKAYGDWMGDMLGKMAGQKGLPQDLGQTAMSLLVDKEYDLLREFLKEHFTEAADSVAEPVDSDTFHETIEKPEFQAAHQIYMERVAPAIAESHERNEGVFSDAVGPLGYFPLTPLSEAIPQGPGRRIPYHAQNNLNNRFATGLSEGYDPSMEQFRKKLNAAVRVNNKAVLFDVLRSEGLAIKQKPGDAGDVSRFAGKETRGVRVETSSPRTIVKDGKVINVGAQFDILPAWLEKELRPILAKDTLQEDDVNNLVQLINRRAVKGLAEPVFHTANIVGTVIANTPYLGTSLRDRAVSNPFTKSFAALGKILATDPTTPEAANDIMEMSRYGGIPERYGTVTYDQNLATTLGAEKVGKWDLSPAMFGPHGLDIRARLYMHRLAKEINPDITPKRLYDVVNQLGNYTTSLQSDIERSLKGSGLSPFYTAGSTMNRNGFNAVFSSGPMPTDGAGIRTAHALTAGLVGTVGAWAITHKAMTGNFPWDDDRAKLLSIPVPDALRFSDLGRAYWGDNEDVGYLSFQFFNPVLGRGTRVTGLRGAFDTMIGEGSGSQMFQAAVRDAVNSQIHPVMGPIPRAALVGLTGMMGQPREPYLTAGPSLLPAAKVNATGTDKAIATLKELNSFYGSLAINTGFGPQEEEDRGNQWVQMVINMAAPHLGERASDPEKRRENLRKSRERQERE